MAFRIGRRLPEVVDDDVDQPGTERPAVLRLLLVLHGFSP
jgi:hypothetical protein